jgi:hypothetical protein
MHSKGLVALFSAALFMASCSVDGDADDAGTRAPPPAVSEEGSPIVTDPPGTDPPGEEAASATDFTGFVVIAVDDLAGRLGVDATTIAVLEVEEVVWPDGAFGCPQPGRVYSQILTEGLRILLGHGGDEFAYHSGGTDEPFLCVSLELTDPGNTTDKQGTVPTEHRGGPGGEPDV